MTYKISGVEIDPQPTLGSWVNRELLGRDGNGRAIYAPTRQFQLSWGILSAEQFDNLQDYFLDIGVTGSLVVDLPTYTTGSYTFQSYTGCYVNEPTFSNYYSEHFQDVTLLITNIITEK